MMLIRHRSLGGRCLAEDPQPGSHLGQLGQSILVDQFVAVLDGDRFWYQNALSADEVRVVEETRLSDVIRRNTSIESELQRDVFHVPAERVGQHRR